MRFILSLVLWSLTFYTEAQQLLVKTANGKVQGVSNKDNTVRIFKGIPFASPPIGDLRWKAPQPVKNWKGIKSCSDFSATAPSTSPPMRRATTWKRSPGPSPTPRSSSRAWPSGRSSWCPARSSTSSPDDGPGRLAPAFTCGPARLLPPMTGSSRLRP